MKRDYFLSFPLLFIVLVALVGLFGITHLKKPHKSFTRTYSTEELLGPEKLKPENRPETCAWKIIIHEEKFTNTYLGTAIRGVHKDGFDLDDYTTDDGINFYPRHGYGNKNGKWGFWLQTAKGVHFFGPDAYYTNVGSGVTAYGYQASYSNNGSNVHCYGKASEGVKP